MTTEPSPNDLAREARLSRDLVLADRDGTPAEDVRDCAVVLIKSGFGLAAERLFDVAELLAGEPFDDCLLTGSVNRGGSTWEVAVNELSGLIAAAEAAPEIGAADVDGHEEPVAPAAVLPDREWLTAEFGPLLKSLLTLRRQQNPLFMRSPRTNVASELIGIAFSSRPLDLTTVGEMPSAVATALAFNVMRRVLIQRGELARAPFGSPALFAATERLTTFGLGLGLANVVLLAPTWPELGLLIGEAWRRRPRKHDLASTIDRFAVLLTIGLPPAALRLLIDELADAGQARILAGILLRFRRQPADAIDTDLLRLVRDALLDLGNLNLAIAAQSRLVEAAEVKSPEIAARDELQASLRNREAARLAGMETSLNRPARKVLRRSGFASTAAQSRQRFGQAS